MIRAVVTALGVVGACSIAFAVAACGFDGSARPDGAGDPDGAGGPDGAGADASNPADAVDGPPTVADAVPEGMCPSTYTVHGRYRVGSTTPWSSGRDDCNDDIQDETITGFTHLAVIGSELERLQLMAVIDPVDDGNIWIGLRDLDQDGDYEWVTTEDTGGFPPGSTTVQGIPPWAGGQPSGNGEDCVRVKNDWAFEDKPCDDDNQILCECDLYSP